MNELLRNITEKSVILAPFNSTLTHSSLFHSSIKEMMLSKKQVLKFNAKVKDLDRQYEANNNEELDNGVYN